MKTKKYFEHFYNSFPSLARPPRRGPMVLIYHDVCDAPSHYMNYQAVTISLRDFENHVRFLAQHADCIPFSDIEKQRHNKRAVCLSFDDGCVSFIDNALPILERYNVPAKLFLALDNIKIGTNWLCKQSYLWNVLDDTEKRKFLAEATGLQIDNNSLPSYGLLWRNFIYPRSLEVVDAWFAAHGPATVAREFLTVAQVRKLAEHPLLELGSHSVHHFPTTSLPEEVLYEEVVGGHKSLQSLVPSVSDYAIPFGIHEFLTEELARCLREIGSPFISAYGGVAGSESYWNIPEIKRQSVGGDIASLIWKMRFGHLP